MSGDSCACVSLFTPSCSPGLSSWCILSGWFGVHWKMHRGSGEMRRHFIQRLEHPQILVSSGGLELIPPVCQLMTTYY